ncbi:MAG TPA: DUF1292 domain-containing protein [Clostridia bacterium]|nr:DUF1292 domain-containing protein [Clostridia bacterium]
MDEKKMRLLLDDNTVMECDVIGKFEVEEKVYIALLPEGNEDVLLYRFFEKDGEIELDRIEEDEEYYNVAEVYYDLFGPVETDEVEVMEE